MSETKPTDKDLKPGEKQPSGQKVTEPSEDDKPRYSTNEVNAYMAASQGSKDLEINRLAPLAAKAETAEKELERVNSELAKREATQAQAEQDAVSEDPEALNLVKQRQSLQTQVRQAQTDLTTAQAETAKVEGISKAANDYNALVKAAELGTEFKIDPNLILSFNPASPEEMRRVAEGLSKTPVTDEDKTKGKRLGSPDGEIVGGEVPTGTPAELAQKAYEQAEKK